MPFTVPAFSTIRDALLRDLKNQLPDAYVGPDSDYFIRATSVASAVEGLYQHQAWIVRQIFPDTADREYLELHARTRGLTRKAAVAAQGQISVAGTPGAAVPTGLTAKLGDQTYVTTQAGVIDANGGHGNGGRQHSRYGQQCLGECCCRADGRTVWRHQPSDHRDHDRRRRRGVGR